MSSHTYLTELKQYRTVRQRTLAMVENLTQQQADFRPSVSSWSAGEILDHLIKSQQMYQQQFQKLAEMARCGERPVLYLTHKDIDLRLPFIPKPLMPLMSAPLSVMNAFVPSVVRETLIRNRFISAENPDVSAPRHDAPIDELRAALRDTMDAQESFFAANPDLPYDQMRVCHAALGYNSVVGLLRISFLHEQRHQDQFAELQKNPQFPRTPSGSRAA
mgnify:CR=1 FL=1